MKQVNTVKKEMSVGLTTQEWMQLRALESNINRRNGNIIRLVPQEIPDSAEEKTAAWKKEHRPLSLFGWMM